MITTTEMRIGQTFPAEIAVFDVESTSPDPQQARIVTAFIGIMDTASGEVTERWSWIVNPGVEIPKEASDIHGITTAEARLRGMDPKEAIFQISQRLDIIAKRSLAIVIMNATYDLTVLDRELERHWPEMRPLQDGVWEIWGVQTQTWSRTPEGYKPSVTDQMRFRVFTPPVIFDPMVLDRAFDKYRKGSRKLVDLAAFYGVPVETNAHDAEADCRMAGRVAIKLLGHARLQDMTLSEVHDKTVHTKRNQTIGPDGLAAYWKKKAASAASVEERADLLARIHNVETVGHYWPLIPRGL